MTIRATGTNCDGRPVTRLYPITLDVATAGTTNDYVDILGFAVFRITSSTQRRLRLRDQPGLLVGRGCRLRRASSEAGAVVIRRSSRRLVRRGARWYFRPVGWHERRPMIDDRPGAWGEPTIRPHGGQRSSRRRSDGSRRSGDATDGDGVQGQRPARQFIVVLGLILALVAGGAAFFLVSQAQQQAAGDVQTDAASSSPPARSRPASRSRPATSPSARSRIDPTNASGAFTDPTKVIGRIRA